VLFEGRDAAGKGGVIKRINLPPRIHNPDYIRGPIPKSMYAPAVY
jgi:polyphosphate kinase 2 (PPK2 family)